MKKKKYEINLFENIIHIKYYSKIEDINDKCILISLYEKKVRICGDGLIINKLDEYEISVIGKYKNIELIYE